MRRTPPFLMLLSVPVLLGAAGCASTGSTPAPALPQGGANSATALHRTVATFAGVETLPGAHRTARRWPSSYPESAKNKPVVFIGDYLADAVLIFPAKKKNPSPIGSITTGISTPAGLATDANGTLYVANVNGADVTEYPVGQTSPSLTLSSGLTQPTSVAVDKAGTVYVANFSPPEIVEYAAGSTTPTATVTSGAFVAPAGIGLDADGNLYMADYGASKVFEIPAGSTTAQPLTLTNPGIPFDVAFDGRDNLYVSNYFFSSNNDLVSIYKRMKNGTYRPNPTRTISEGLEGPFFLGFDAEGVLFVSNVGASSNGTVAAYKPGASKPFEQISGFSTLPSGIASNPALQP